MRSLTRERGVGVQLAHTLLEQAEAQRQHGRVFEQVEHDAVAGGLIGRDLLALQLHHLHNKVRRLGLVVPQQLVEHFQSAVGYLPLGGSGEQQTSEGHTAGGLRLHGSPALYLLSRTTISSGREGEEHRVTQEVQVRLETWDAQPGAQINRQAALHECADQVTEGSSQRVLLTARLDLIQLHLRGTTSR